MTEARGQWERKTRQSAETSRCLKTPSVETHLQKASLPKPLFSKWNKFSTNCHSKMLLDTLHLQMFC